ncbi:hypothetical protein K438DRAFT_1948474 [Mycena galopus ATCC 62051]|nr:hypothetical protein K438DRAFT_1948474 [Mycena galopus ATCC 62051]
MYTTFHRTPKNLDICWDTFRDMDIETNPRKRLPSSVHTYPLEELGHIVVEYIEETSSAQPAEVGPDIPCPRHVRFPLHSPGTRYKPLPTPQQAFANTWFFALVKSLPKRHQQCHWPAKGTHVAGNFPTGTCTRVWRQTSACATAFSSTSPQTRNGRALSKSSTFKMKNHTISPPLLRIAHLRTLGWIRSRSQAPPCGDSEFVCKKGDLGNADARNLEASGIKSQPARNPMFVHDEGNETCMYQCCLVSRANPTQTTSFGSSRWCASCFKLLREPKINTELAYVKTEHLHDTEDFLGMNFAVILELLGNGSRCKIEERSGAMMNCACRISKARRSSITIFTCCKSDGEALLDKWRNPCQRISDDACCHRVIRHGNLQVIHMPPYDRDPIQNERLKACRSNKVNSSPAKGQLKIVEGVYMGSRQRMVEGLDNFHFVRRRHSGDSEPNASATRGEMWKVWTEGPHGNKPNDFRRQSRGRNCTTESSIICHWVADKTSVFAVISACGGGKPNTSS